MNQGQQPFLWRRPLNVNGNATFTVAAKAMRNRLTAKVLQMAKLDKSKLNLNLTAVDLNEVITDAAEYISLQVEPRGGTVTTELRAAPSIVEGDLTHLSSLINNLLDVRKCDAQMMNEFTLCPTPLSSSLNSLHLNDEFCRSLSSSLLWSVSRLRKFYVAFVIGDCCLLAQARPSTTHATPTENARLRTTTCRPG